MTNPLSLEQVLPVTQADRDAAAQIYMNFRDHDYAGWVRSGTNASGEADSVIQAFARHRLSSSLQSVGEVERIAEWLREQAGDGYFSGWQQGKFESLRKAADAIERGEHRSAKPSIEQD